MSFQTPGYLVLLLLLPVAIYLRHFWRGRGGRLSFSFRSWHGPGLTFRARLLGFVRLLAALAFWCGAAALILSLAGPMSTIKHRVFLSRGVGIMFVLDQSPSMFAADLTSSGGTLAPVGSTSSSGGGFPAAANRSSVSRESRFDAATQVISAFVRRRENDPVGLVSFAKDAVLRIPPTLDYHSFLDRLANLNPHGLGNGTAIGMGIGVAVLHLRDSDAPKKAIILLTDGENNAGEVTPEHAAQVAADLGIRIYAVGIGSRGEAPITYTDPETGKLYTGVLRGAFDEGLLKNIAETTGGRYFNAATTNSLANVLTQIDSMESVQRRVSIQTRSIPRHRGFIILGFLLVLGSVVIREGLLREALG